MQDPTRTTPVRIDADRAAGTLSVEWADGHRTTYDSVRLRWLCPCAYCRGEAGMPGWLDTDPTLTPEQTRLADVALVGSYAIQVMWGDGHATGYHTYRLLRHHCPCEACEQDRARRHAEHGGAGDGDEHAATGADAPGGQHPQGGDR